MGSHDGCIFLSGIGALLLARGPRLGQSAECCSPILNDLLWFLRTSALWKDLPTCSGPVGAVLSQLHRWRQAGVFERADACRDFDCDLASVLPGTS
ncbi:transposase [Methylorubrum extorquens]|uniref:transposase n=1 Tax=Methylorubrum extorquens TaxID=408 RepID=UPI00167F8B18